MTHPTFIAREVLNGYSQFCRLTVLTTRDPHTAERIEYRVMDWAATSFPYTEQPRNVSVEARDSNGCFAFKQFSGATARREAMGWIERDATPAWVN